MIGAIIGDIVGSRFEFVEDGNRGKDFALFASGCCFTDDSLIIKFDNNVISFFFIQKTSFFYLNAYALVT